MMEEENKESLRQGEAADLSENEPGAAEEPSAEASREAPDPSGEAPAEAAEGGTDAEAEAPEAEAATGDEAAESAAKPKKKKAVSAPKRGARKSTAKAKKTPASKKKAAAAEPAALEIDDVAPEDRLPMKWYVIHTYSGHENKVKENIQKMVKTSGVKNQFGRLIVPTEEVAEMKKGKKTITTRKFFPSYILIEMFMSEESWHLVNSIPGVTSFVGTGTTPQPLSEGEVERILGRMDKEKDTIIPEIPFTLGEHIRIKDGPFSDFTGIIDEINTEKGKLRVLVSIFGRETPVELDFLQVETI